MDIVSLLKNLSDAFGVSGHEAPVRALVCEAFAPRCDSVKTDTMGNVIGYRRGTQKGRSDRRSIMITGHMDEIGLMVTDLEGAFIRFHQVGGFDVRTLPGQEVVVHGSKPLPGIIGYRAPHVASGETKPTPMEELFIDVGLSARQLKQCVSVGDVITLKSVCTALGSDRLCGKAFDDRAAMAAISLCLDMLSNGCHAWDVYAVASVQEEVGLRGAFTATYGVMPDLGIAIDVGFGKQPGVTEGKRVELDKGPALCLGPTLHPLWTRRIKGVADEEEIPVQDEVAARSTSTEADAIQITREGVPAALLSIPTLNMHTPVETLSVNDVRRTARLLAAVITRLDDATLDDLVLDQATSGGAA